jgi:type IV pilus assembly protein PilB
MGVIPAAFSRANHIVAIEDSSSNPIFALDNPFDFNILGIIKDSHVMDGEIRIALAAPENIEALFKQPETDKVKIAPIAEKSKTGYLPTPPNGGKPPVPEIEENPIVSIANKILSSAASERASDIHIEPKENNTTIRFRIDGNMRDFFDLKKNTGVMLIARLKAISGLDIAERRKPQDGAVEANINNRSFKLRPGAGGKVKVPE